MLCKIIKDNLVYVKSGHIQKKIFFELWDMHKYSHEKRGNKNISMR